MDPLKFKEAMSESELSFFHKEVLDCIKKETLAQSIVQDLDSQDTGVISLLQKLKTTPEPLEGIEAYHRLFWERGPIHLERNLMRSFSNSSFLSIYRGLPRLYKKDLPAYSKIKKNFTHLSLLKRIVIEKEVYKLYRQFIPSATSKLVFFTWVLSDGSGDYMAAMEVMQLIEKKFPFLQLEWVLLVPQGFCLPARPSNVKIHLEAYDSLEKIPSLEKAAKQILRSADLVVQIPTYYPKTVELIAEFELMDIKKPAPLFVSIGEYGFIDSDDFHPGTGTYALGLHFLEKGILIREPHSGSAFKDLEHKELLLLLFANSSPTSLEEEKYLQTHDFYFAYLATPIGGAIYLHALFELHRTNDKNIDLCTPDLGWFLGYIAMQQKAGRPYFEVEGWRIELYTQGTQYVLTDLPEHKTMRIFHTGPISSFDFKTLIFLSQEFVGVRGNQSFSEAISLNKLFFYDGKEHCLPLMKDFLALATHRLKKGTRVVRFLQSMLEGIVSQLRFTDEDWVDESYFQEKRPWLDIAQEIGQALMHHAAVSDFKLLNQMIQKEHSANQFCLDLIQRALYQRAHPLSVQTEEEYIQEFLGNESSILEVLQKIKTHLR